MNMNLKKWNDSPGRWSGNFHVVNSITNESIESHSFLSQAVQATGWINDHEIRNNRKPIYKVEEL